MSWYATEHAAEKAAKRKQEEFGEEYVVVKDAYMPCCYYAQRKSSLANAPSPSLP